jgi:hypothetical protein
MDIESHERTVKLGYNVTNVLSKNIGYNELNGTKDLMTCY